MTIPESRSLSKLSDSKLADPYFNGAIEESFLACAMNIPELVDRLATTLEPDDFFIVKHGWLWEALVALRREGLETDSYAVLSRLSPDHTDQMGGAAGVLDIGMRTFGVNILGGETYGLLIQGLAWKRRALHALSQLGAAAHDVALTPQALLDRFDAAYTALVKRYPGQQEAVIGGKDAISHYQECLTGRAADDAPSLLYFPYDGWTANVPSVAPGKLTLITGFSGQGKSILCEECAEWAAMLGLPTFYISTEMGFTDFMDRMAARHTGVAYSTLISKLSDRSKIVSTLRAAAGEWLPRLDFWPATASSAGGIYRQMQRAFESGRKVIVLDYLGERMFLGKSAPTKKQMDQFVVYVDRLAQQYRGYVIMASQLSPSDFGPRVYGSSVPHHTAAYHIRLESQTVKQDGTFIAGGRSFAVKKGDPSPMMRCVFEKARFGDTRDCLMFRDGARFRFLGESQVEFVNGDGETVTLARDYETVYRGGD